MLFSVLIVLVALPAVLHHEYYGIWTMVSMIPVGSSHDFGSCLGCRSSLTDSSDSFEKSELVSANKFQLLISRAGSDGRCNTPLVI